MSNRLPRVTRTYQNHHLDSTRWEVYSPRPDDLIVTTSYKSGTTWTQEILLQLLHGEKDPLPSLNAISPWVGARFMGRSKEDLRALLESLAAPRFLKSHLPLDGLPYYEEARYIIVGRDPRDVFMSLFNHYHSYTETAYALFNAPDAVGPEFPRCPDEPRQLWRDWMTRGWFEWESEGYPMWSNLHHTKTYWDYRGLPNFLFLHYNDMLADLPGAIRRLAEFSGIEVSSEDVERVTQATTFATVRKRAEATPEGEDPAALIFEGGVRTFFHKGKNGRWRDVLNAEDLALYEAAKQRVLSPECAKWLEEGGPVGA